MDLSIPPKVITSPDDIEAITVQLLTCHPIKLCIVYNPPNSDQTYQQKLLSFLSGVMQSDVNVIIIIMGDFNTPGY